MSLRRQTMKRTLITTDHQANVLIHSVTGLLQHDIMDQIIGIDETNWPILAPGVFIWAVKGAEAGECIVATDDKERVTRPYSSKFCPRFFQKTGRGRKNGQ
jgi:hypothetical protein